MTSRIEQARASALLAALRSEEEGAGLVQRVRARQEAILRSRERGQWVQIDPEALARLVGRLDGPRSTCRHLGIAVSTLRRWAAEGRIRRWALVRLEELVATGARSLRRPNRAADRNYLRGGTDGP
ncbi:hypothetical protein BE20_25025 [Sorangium cellulosum]|uniref:Uncharacterized protein n=1 Tax=Sorangium cellulosum TaxID=56 RepID=A0A150S9X7_SORCE|nr:hypothetical protein BE20_25025 [Sorangium cellulosum]KYF89255.1 hypothetical protein BE18_22745 [Sorangium cellulosum]